MTLPSSLRLKNSPNSQGNLPSSLKPKKKVAPSFDETRPMETDEDLQRDIERNQAQFTSRMLERTLGAAGSLAEMIPEELGLFLPGVTSLKALPSESDIRKQTSKLGNGYLEPKNKLEERVGEFSGDVASYMTGGAGKTALGTAARTIGIPLAGQIAKEAGEKIGLGEKGQDHLRLGSMVILDLMGLRHGVMEGGAKKYGLNRLNEARQAASNSLPTEVPILEKELLRHEGKLSKGLSGPAKQPTLDAIKDIKSQIIDGKIDPSLFTTLREDINKAIGNLGGFTLKGASKSTHREAIIHLNELKNSIIRAGNRWGRKNSPEFLKNWRAGNEALSADYKSKEISKFIGKHTKVTNPILRTALGLSTMHHPVAAGAAMAGKALAKKGITFPSEIMYKFFKSKVLNQLYGKVLTEASKGNGPALASSVKKLEMQMKKEGIEEDQ